MPEQLAERVWSAKSQSSLLNIYLSLSGFQLAGQGWLSNRMGTSVDNGKVCWNMTSSAQFATLPLAKPVVWFARAIVNWHSCSFAKSVYSLPLQSKYLFTLHENETQNPSDMWCSSSKISTVQLRSITEIMPKPPFLCVNKNPNQHDFHAGARAIQRSINIAISEKTMQQSPNLQYY